MPLPIAPLLQSGLPSLPIGVLVVDDQAAVREGLSRLIACAPLALRAVCSAANGAEALAIAAWLQPDLVLLDVDLAGEDGLALIPALMPAAVLVLSCHGDAATRQRAIRQGAGAFIEKQQPAAELLGALVRLVALQMRGEQSPAPQGTGSHAVPVASSGAPGRHGA